MVQQAIQPGRIDLAREIHLQPDVVGDRQGLKQIAGLQHDADRGGPAPRSLRLRPPRELHALQHHVAAIRLVEPGEAGQQGRLAAAGGAHESHQLARGHAHADTPQRQGVSASPLWKKR